MTALLAEAAAAGLTVEARGGRLAVRGPKQAEPVARQILARKAEIMPLLQGWDSETVGLIHWFLDEPSQSMLRI